MSIDFDENIATLITSLVVSLQAREARLASLRAEEQEAGARFFAVRKGSPFKLGVEWGRKKRTFVEERARLVNESAEIKSRLAALKLAARRRQNEGSS